MDNRTGLFTSDKVETPPLTDTTLRELSGQQGQELTYTCVPPGSGHRMGIDRDDDGIVDDNDHPDLTATITRAERKIKSSGHKLVTEFTLSNIGTETAQGPFPISVVLSNDNSFDPQDQLLETFTFNRVKQERQKSRTFKRKRLSSLDGKFVLLVIDADGVVQDGNRDNNVIAQQIR
jgi:hypothetical protein